MSSILAADQLKSDACRALASHWKDQCRGRAMPARADIDPLTLPRRALPHVFLAEIQPTGEAPPRFVYRIVGTAITAMTGRDVTGHAIGAETYGALAGEILKPFRRVAANARPIATQLRADHDAGCFEFETVYLPLGQGAQPHFVLGAIGRLDASWAKFAADAAFRTSFSVHDLAI